MHRVHMPASPLQPAICNSLMHRPLNFSRLHSCPLGWLRGEKSETKAWNLDFFSLHGGRLDHATLFVFAGGFSACSLYGGRGGTDHLLFSISGYCGLCWLGLWGSCTMRRVIAPPSLPLFS
ncbi:hypothetical protein DM02DRAFT_244297 [Periconia macrospinosa]|uniref:Uncharacterized protein n=1 Tax=Periconia macrospinosa TaxID=97972 RepID=A0A2V1D5B1_9PLEO|nr:hypothetical protein DM02DRAFT_244297 [Periconia macrospinosa]